MFSEEKLSHADQKTTTTKQSISIKPFYSNTLYGLEYEKTSSVNYLCLPNASLF